MTAPILTPDHPATLRFVFPADFPSARAAAAAVRSFLAEQGVAVADLFGYELCVAEACNNSVEYAIPPGPENRSLVEAVCSTGQIELRVSDHTEGFDWPTSFENPAVHSERGRGLFIIHSFMDEVLYLRGGKENLLVMRKRRPVPAISTGPKEAAPTTEED